MKKLLSLMLLFTLTCCGMAEDLTKRCSGDMDLFCDFVLGQDPKKDEQLTDRVADLEERVKLLTELISDGLQTDANLQNMIMNLQNDSEDNSLLLSMLQIQVDLNESSIHNLIVSVAELESNYNIVEIVDPCGDGPSFDEIVLIMSDGSIVAWYKDLGLSVLPNGNYQTTDTQKCNFQVLNGEIL